MVSIRLRNHFSGLNINVRRKASSSNVLVVDFVAGQTILPLFKYTFLESCYWHNSCQSGKTVKAVLWFVRNKNNKQSPPYPLNFQISDVVSFLNRVLTEGGGRRRRGG